MIELPWMRDRIPGSDLEEVEYARLNPEGDVGDENSDASTLCFEEKDALAPRPSWMRRLRCLQVLLPSFLHPDAGPAKRIHPSAWLGM